MKNLILGLCLLGLLTRSLNAFANQSLRFDLPAQPIENGLIEFGLQAQINLIVDQGLFHGQRSRAVVGAYTVGDALKKLLSETDLEPIYIAKSKSWFLQKKPLTEIKAHEEIPVYQNNNNVEEINVTGQLHFPMRYNNVTNTQLHAGMSYFDSSRFLNVIPQTLIEDQQASDMFDAIKYTSGISSSDGLNDSNDDFYIRGFKRNSIYIDGFRVGDSLGSKMLPANIERVEVIKGPSTLLYGQAEPGGVVNFVRKRSEEKSFATIESGVGSYGKKFIEMDVNNPIKISDNFDYRLIVSAESKDAESEMENIARQLISLSTNYHFTANTDLSIHYDTQHSEQTDPRDFLVAAAFTDVAGDSFPGANLADGIHTKREHFTSDLQFFSTEFSHYFESDWRLLIKYDWMNENRIGVRSTTETLLNNNGLINPDVNFDTFFVFGAQLLVPINIISNSTGNYYQIGRIRSLYDEAGFETANKVSFTLEGSRDWGSYLHHISMGIDWHQQNIYKGYLIEERTPVFEQLIPDTELDVNLANIFNGVFNPERALGEITVQESRLVYDDYGAFFQDSIELNDQWIFNAGTRLIMMKGSYRDITESTVNHLQDYEHLSSQFGLVYQYSNQYSWFGSYSEALQSNYHLDDVGSALIDPELSYQFEMGVKSLLDNGHFLSSLAVFQINKDNVVDHVLDQGLRTSLGLYSMRAKGIDADFTWRINPQWDLMGAMSIQSTEILNGPYAGERTNMAADQIASIFTHHQFNNHLAVNFGVNYVSDRASFNRLVSAASRVEDIADDYKISAYAELDCSIVYSMMLFNNDTKMKFLIKNLTNTQYYKAATPGVRENYAEGRFFQLSIEASI